MNLVTLEEVSKQYSERQLLDRVGLQINSGDRIGLIGVNGSGKHLNWSIGTESGNLLEPGDTVLGLSLDHGGHLTHGSPVNFSGKTYNFVPYGVGKDDGTLDYDALEALGIVAVRHDAEDRRDEVAGALEEAVHTLDRSTVVAFGALREEEHLRRLAKVPLSC